jgi:hypothetical protein
MTTQKPFWSERDIAIIQASDGLSLAALAATLPTPERLTYATQPYNINDPTIIHFPPGPTDWADLAEQANREHIYAVTISGILQALIFHSLSTDCLNSIYTFGAPLRLHPQFATIHYAYIELAERLSASIALDPAGPHHPYLVTRHGAQLPPDPAYTEHASYGAVVLPADTTLNTLDLVLDRKHLTIDVSALPQHMLDAIRTAKGTIYSTSHHVLLRNLRDAGNIVLTQAEMVMLPALCDVSGALIARMATYVDARRLAAVERVSMPKLQFADFPALTRALADIHLPMARNAAFPALRFCNGEIQVPRRTKLFTPRLAEVKRTNTNAPMQMMEEMELSESHSPENLVFLNLTA